MNERNRIVSSLLSGKISVVCATKAFGRGVNVPDIRFVFHAVFPLNLRDYVQETGRAGRDGKPAFCTLFYRPHDRTRNEDIVGINRRDSSRPILEGKELDRAVSELDAVVRYATSGDLECRYGHLSVLVPASRTENGSQTCRPESRCDNCSLQAIMKEARIKSTGGNSSDVVNVREVDVNLNWVVLAVLREVQRRYHDGDGMKISEVKTFVTKTAATMNDDDDDEPLLLEAVLKAHGSQVNLAEDLLRLLESYNVINRFGGSRKGKVDMQTSNYRNFVKQLESGDVRIIVRHVRQYLTGQKWLERMEQRKSIVEISGGEHEDNPHTARIEDGTTVGKRKANEGEQNEADDIDGVEFVSSQPPRKVHRTLPPSAQPGHLIQTLYTLKIPKVHANWWESLSFLPQFELLRLYNSGYLTDQHISDQLAKSIRDSSFHWTDQLKICTYFHCLADKEHTMSLYRKALDMLLQTSSSVDTGTGSGLYFSAEFKNDRLRLLSPERAYDRRIFRKFGSHRFLDIKLISVRSPKMENMLRNDVALNLCGRTYRRLWVKMVECPQVFIYFAEKGHGIDESEEISAAQVRQWCVPITLNPGLTVGKFFKRVKLSFSKTTPTAILPQNSLKVIDDIMSDDGENVMTDGCGLISPGALQLVYETSRDKGLMTQKDNCSEDSGSEVDDDVVCPYTSFQGRIGGFKGMWVLDSTLGEEILVLCRKSQLKYHVPMRSVFPSNDNDSTLRRIEQEMEFDDAYDTVDLCSWDCNPHQSRLSLRHVQIFGHRGVSLEYLKKCVDQGIKPITNMTKEFSENRKDTLINRRKKNALAHRDDDDQHSNDLLLQMALADVPPREPVFKNAFISWAKFETRTMQEKAKYPANNCRYLRLIPDHTGFLEEGEAFVAGTDDIKTSIESGRLKTHLLAMRSPAYFSGDLVKLKLVRRRTLLERFSQKCQRQNVGGVGEEGANQTDAYSFFDNLRTGLILSTRGRRSAAEMMSGGDFDGDEAWVSWDKVLVDQVASAPPVDTSGEEFKVEKSPEENMLLESATEADLYSYARHFKGHLTNLRKLSKMLDTSNDLYDFDHEITKAIATNAFLQVDHPYNLCELPKSYQQHFEERKRNEGVPHWSKASEKTYRSSKLMGEVHDYVESKISSVEEDMMFKGQQDYFNPYFLKVIQKAEKDDPDNLERQRTVCSNAVKNFNKEANEYLKNNNNAGRSRTEKGVRDQNSVDNAWFDTKYNNYNDELFKNLNSVDEQLLRASVLYEQTIKVSRHNSSDKVSNFAWRVAGGLLQRIHGDGSSRRVLPVITKHAESVLYA